MSNKILIMNGHNSTAALVSENCLAVVVHEEKLSGVKNDFGFPSRAIDKIFEMYPEAGLSQLDFFFFQKEMHQRHSKKCFENRLQNQAVLFLSKSLAGYFAYFYKAIFGALPWVRKICVGRLAAMNRFRLKQLIMRDYSGRIGSINFLDHHLSHCVSPLQFYNCIDGNQWVCISLDGAGDGLSSQVILVDHSGDWKTLATSDAKDSVGMFYHEATEFLNMKGGEHEFKFMGLAAYADEAYVRDAALGMSAYFEVNDDLTITSRISSDNWRSLFQKKYSHLRFDSFAGAVQAALEMIVLSYLERVVEVTGVYRLALSGGIFMNVCLNAKLAKISGLKALRIMPSAGDESHVYGMAYLTGARNPPNRMYLGMACDPSAVIRRLEDARVAFAKTYYPEISDLNTRVAKLLSEGAIVGRISGRGEWGARSFGNRAILGPPNIWDTCTSINYRVKSRDFWMPFAPTILEEAADKYIDDWQFFKGIYGESLRFMTVTVPSTELGRSDFVAARHAKDGSFRAQILDQTENSDYYDLIKKYEAITGIAGLLNTSFNLHGCPLADSEEDVARTFVESDLDYLIIDHYLLEKNRD